MEESKILQLKNKGKSIFQIAYELNMTVEDVIKIIYGNTKLAQTTLFKNYAPVKVKCLSCGKMFISKNKKTNRICNKCKKEQASLGYSEYLGY